MDTKIYKQIEAEIEGFTTIIAKYNDEKESEAFWAIKLEASGILGYISINNNKEDIMVQTLNFSLILNDISNISKEAILGLFSLNTKLHACSLSAEVIEEKLTLLLNRKILLSSYIKGQVEANIDIMLQRVDIFQDVIKEIIYK